MKIEEIKGNLKTLEEQKEAIIKRLNSFDKRIEEIKNKLDKLGIAGEK